MLKNIEGYWGPMTNNFISNLQVYDLLENGFVASVFENTRQLDFLTEVSFMH
jgi:hypothetical protein